MFLANFVGISWIAIQDITLKTLFKGFEFLQSYQNLVISKLCKDI